MISYPCGLYFRTGPHPLSCTYLPQVQLKSHTTINPVCFTTTLEQIFRNPNERNLDQARYTFPLYDGVTVNSYTISYANKIIKGVVKQKDDARQTFNEAVARGETAGLLESLPAGIFGVTIGNVPAQTDVNVELTYCGELKHDAAIDGLRFMLPTSIAPRYGEYPGVVLQNNSLATDGIALTVDIDMAGLPIRKVQSPSHPISVSMGGLSATSGINGLDYVPSKASATLALGSAELSDDFVLQMLIDKIDEPQAILETHPTLPNHRAIMATLVPRFTLPAGNPEIVFIADQSGSMRGAKNAALVAALKVLLKSLPFGVRFNICAFGNEHKFLWKNSQAYNESNLSKALKFVGSFNASYGGTEILPPLVAAFKNRLADLPLEVMLLTDGEVWGEHSIFEFLNENIQDKGVDARVFALGIGRDVSHSLVEGVARAGNGFAQFVTESEEIDKKVIRMLKGALFAHTKNYEIEVHYEKGEENEEQDDGFELVEKVRDCLQLAHNNDEDLTPDETTSTRGIVSKAMSFFDKSAKVDGGSKNAGVARYAHLPSINTPKLMQVPSEIPPLFPFSRSTVYILLGPETAQSEVCSITLRATSALGPIELDIPVRYSEMNTKIPTIHQLAAGKAAHELEEGRGWLQKATSASPNGKEVATKLKYASRFDEIVEREAVRLGVKFQVAGKWTSFVAVESHSEEMMELNEGHLLDNPNEHPHETFKSFTPGTNSLNDVVIKAVSISSTGSVQPRRARPQLFGGLFGSSSATRSSPQIRGRSSPRRRKASLSLGLMSRRAPPSSPMSIDACCAASESIPEQYDCIEDLNEGFSAAATEEGAPQKKKGSSDPMRTLINLQDFSGCWKWASSLFDAIATPEASVRPEILWGGDTEKDKTICATLLAIAFLEVRLRDKKDIWEMVVQKARSWLATTLGKPVDENWIETAAAYLPPQ